ncbi:hypothetical protein [Paraburkholderia bannensis]|uniref:hypothetical protein n=1 Tax=Paraburkholderia bannensis TaxID=765414 RepID=UPI002ABDB187|nr:hypothetical protein [Paraburkholderia bannensis]
MRKAVIGAVSALLVAGCAIKPSATEMAAADYGAYPDDYKQIIESYESMRLKDPDSARYQYLGMPVRAWGGHGSGKFGYAVCALINAKNSYGGYVGARPNYFLIRDGRVVRAIEGDGQFVDAMATGACKSVNQY